MKKIYLFRHGETDWNQKNICQGQMDIELNETGLEQAKCNAEMLKDFGIQYIYSSPLKRALKTAQILAEKINVEIEVVDDFKEGNTGDMTGKFKSQMEEVFGREMYRRFLDEGIDVVPYPNGESGLDVQKRSTRALEYVLKNDKHDVIAIATHGGVLCGVLKNFGFEDISMPRNCEIIGAEYDGKDFKIKRRIKNSEGIT